MEANIFQSEVDVDSVKFNSEMMMIHEIPPLYSLYSSRDYDVIIMSLSTNHRPSPKSREFKSNHVIASGHEKPPWAKWTRFAWRASSPLQLPPCKTGAFSPDYTTLMPYYICLIPNSTLKTI